MLATLKVRDLVLIENLTLDFAPGLNVLTGETGAGKSILLDALGLAVGNRAGVRSTVRAGAGQGSAVAVFDLPSGSALPALLSGNGLPMEREIILRRVVSADGRTRAFINDEPVGVGLLRDTGSVLLELHGQSDDRGLFDISTHRRLLDSYGAYPEILGEVTQRFEEWDGARRQLDALRTAAQEAAADADLLRHTVQELSALAPVPGEEEQLAAERALLLNAARIAEDVSAAIDALTGDRGAESCLAAALKKLSRMSEDARRLTEAAEASLDQAFALAQDARRELDSMLSQLELDAGDLERKEERLFALRDAARKFAVPADGLERYLEECAAKLDSIEGGGTRLKAAELQESRAATAYDEAAARLSTARRHAAASLEAAVHAELIPLKLGHARFRCRIEPLSSRTAQGAERIEFEIATVEGAGFGSLTKIASGGELARISLALKVALAGASPPAVLIFDEIDRGVGGAVADAVGKRLQRLARSMQVLLVTHSPQVAARGARHFRITRNRDRTSVQALEPAEREEEIARMLSGAAITEEARAAARRLLREAQAQSNKPKVRA